MVGDQGRPGPGSARPSARRARGGCGGSSPTPPTSPDAPSLRSAATRSSSGSAPTPTPTISARRCAESRRSRRGWGRAVDELLTLARLDEVRELRRERVDLAEIAADAAEDARASAPGRLVKLDIAGEGGTEMRGDPGQVRQVAANLLANAVAHTPEGTPVEVTVDRRPRTTWRSGCATRPGLPAAPPRTLSTGSGAKAGCRGQRGRLRAARPRDRRRRRRGHGGQVEAGNAPGGAVLTVTLPRRAPVEAGAAAPALVAGSQASS